jgi:hypothetical protein
MSRPAGSVRIRLRCGVSRYEILASRHPGPYILLGHTLAEVHANLPPNLVRSGRQPSDQPEVVEAWLRR